MLVVLLTAALLALSSAQNTDEEVSNAEISDVKQQPDSDSDLPSDDVNPGNVQDHESAPAANEEPSVSPGNEQEEQQQQPLPVENQEPSDKERHRKQKRPPPETLHHRENLRPQIYRQFGIRPFGSLFPEPYRFQPWA
uniref:SMR2 protein n=1 Tax=Rattus norvegicus TaxID=10116 RepID=SMR2_RAT|nr:RecName: Full=SMR2 protein; Flags: Precursor [Rattus norvegicus]AAA42155.1 SMR2 protein [Rattus norvegicus]AAA42156.1 SMR2 protein [Rattus norvegicus]